MRLSKSGGSVLWRSAFDCGQLQSVGWPRGRRVRVAEEDGEAIKLFSPSGSPVTFWWRTAGNTSGNEITGPVAGEQFNSGLPWSMATDAEGDLYVALRGSNGGIVDEFNSCGELIREFNGPESASSQNLAGGGNFGKRSLEGLAIDPTDGHVLIGENGGAIFEFDSGGHYLNEIPNAASGVALASLGGMAVSSEGHLGRARPGPVMSSMFL